MQLLLAHEHNGHAMNTNGAIAQGAGNNKAMGQATQPNGKKAIYQAQDQAMKQEEKGHGKNQTQQQDKKEPQDHKKEQAMPNMKEKDRMQEKGSAQSQFKSTCSPKAMGNADSQGQESGIQEKADTKDGAMSYDNKGQTDTKSNVNSVGGSQTGQIVDAE